MGRAHSSQKGWTLVSQGARSSPELVSAALIDPQRGGQTTLSASQVVAGSKRHQNRGIWNSLQKSYVQQWTSIG
ncbi:jg22138 [Pararge aegeria aegeria]|uniref:Jg22138 protein n=1 Tax=Pararge aegeria aegeria TaxID=348720 RepID=A0A8S4RSS9_9NEOP|nr:jg22138 [Pararge aegeria aegeria]